MSATIVKETQVVGYKCSNIRCYALFLLGDLINGILPIHKRSNLEKEVECSGSQIEGIAISASDVLKVRGWSIFNLGNYPLTTVIF
jgi:hypothetical protein